MKKIVIHRPGGYRRLCIETCPDPRPAADEILIAVHAIGVNYADCVTRMGLYTSAKVYQGYPITPGFEVAGHVLAVGTEITDYVPGMPVMAVTRFDGYATRLLVRAHQVYPLPENLDMNQAAGFPAVSLTAWYALFRLAHAGPGERILVHSAAGGVGGTLVQLANIAGCRVTGVVGATHKVEAVRALGADAVIDKSCQDLWREAEKHAPGGYHVILDANGVTTLKQSYRHLAPMGRLVVYGFHGMLPRQGGRPNRLRLAWDYLRTPRFNPFSLTTRNRSILGFNLSFLFDESDILSAGMGQLMAWLADGRLRGPTTTVYPFEQVADAHRDLESGATIGKLILRIDE